MLVESPENYARAPATIRVLRPLFGGGLFLSAGEEWRQQRRSAAAGFAPRTVRLVAGQIVEAVTALAAEGRRGRRDRPRALTPTAATAIRSGADTASICR